MTSPAVRYENYKHSYVTPVQYENYKQLNRLSDIVVVDLFLAAADVAHELVQLVEHSSI